MRICLLDSGVGIIPFIKEIIIQDKKNEYYLYMDSSFFPYGNKNEEEMTNHSLDLLKRIEKLNIDLLLICCNTLSYFYFKNIIKTSYNVKTIFELNMPYIHNLITTSLLSKEISSLNGKNLASIIENNDIYSLVNYIKEMDKKTYYLGCTHYPLAKGIFTLYKINVHSLEKQFISNLPSEKKMIFYIQKKDEERIRSFFPKLSINYYSL